ncbi:hypothetical protein VPH35_012718 [Triticum aestivum]|uniref:Integrase catalytic domain-containing protein n=1 Tax=Aegilops tauschii subsp. strangulata TaxID=200361 RepID=A0A452XPT5_AEGTS
MPWFCLAGLSSFICSDDVVCLHGVPASIVSDRDRVFTSHFWRKLFKEVGAKLCYLTAYHPQTDGQYERVNQCLEQYLRCSVRDSPAKRKKWLPMAEFWYNSSYHTSLGCTPFKVLYGIDPNFGAMPSLEDELDSSLAELSADRADLWLCSASIFAAHRSASRLKLRSITKTVL